jgi:capsular polysaccharide biosynthesis protein
MGLRMTRADRRRRRAVVGRILTVILVIAGGVAGYLVTGELQPAYQATTTLMVGDLTSDAEVSAADIDTSLSLATAYATLIRSATVLSPVITQLQLPTTWSVLRNQVHVTPDNGGVPTITVEVIDPNPRAALAIARAVAAQTVALAPGDAGIEASGTEFASEQADRLETAIRQAQTRLRTLERQARATASPGQRASIDAQITQQTNALSNLQANYLAFTQTVTATRSSNKVSVLEPAAVTKVPLRPHRTVNAGLGAGIGLLLGVALTVRPPRRRVDGDERTADGDGVAERRRAPSLPPRPGERQLDPWIRELRDPAE